MTYRHRPKNKSGSPKTAKRSGVERQRDLAFIAPLYLRGLLRTEIRDKLNEVRDYDVSLNMIHADIQILFKQWRDRNEKEIGIAKAVEIEKINELERAYWDEWFNSRGKKRKVTYKEKSKTEVIWTDAGDPRYLEGVRWCIERRCAIFGINAPQEVHHKHSGAHGGPIELQNLSEFSDEELEVIRRLGLGKGKKQNEYSPINRFGNS